MTTDWKLLDFAQRYDDYEPVRERVLAYPIVFEELGLARRDCHVVLDYGCGAGKVSALIARNYDVSVIAVDVSPGMLAIAGKKRAHPRITYQLIAEDQRLDIREGSVDAALSCFVFVVIPEAERIRRIVREVHRLLRPGAVYAIVDHNPDAVGLPFEFARVGEAGRTYAPGDPLEVHLSTPAGPPVVVHDFYWPKTMLSDVLEETGFRNVRVATPTLPPTFRGPEAPRMQLERKKAPYAIYLGQK
ncbi:class I SAM-dependent methyltransferase [Pendulispora rubella]|uniref:Class I SAM-dependent methyltransferase n=1 Tax=Pendulispora rubella TaxID=2741070 RepID=A0ABZ2LDC9_9BACT